MTRSYFIIIVFLSKDIHQCIFIPFSTVFFIQSVDGALFAYFQLRNRICISNVAFAPTIYKSRLLTWKSFIGIFRCIFTITMLIRSVLPLRTALSKASVNFSRLNSIATCKEDLGSKSINWRIKLVE